MSGMIKPVEWKETYVKVLDQTLLPEEVKFMEIRDAQVMWDAIKMLCVRGAPAIGVGAGYGVAIEMQKHVKESTAKYHKKFIEIIYVFLTIFLYLLKCPQSLILSALRAFLLLW